jgi:hypothetical protein
MRFPSTAMHSPPRELQPADAAFDFAMSRMAPGWVTLRGVRLAGWSGDAPYRSVQIRYVLLHPEVGVALVDAAPDRTPDAVERLRRVLDAARFWAIFAGHLPIVQLSLGAVDLPRLTQLVDAAFAAEQGIALPGGHAWIGLARRVLGGVVVSAPAAPPAPQPPAAPNSGWRALGRFWMAVLLTLGGGALLLQFLGPPQPEPAAVLAGGAGAVRSVLPSRRIRRYCHSSSASSPSIRRKISPPRPGSS